MGCQASKQLKSKKLLASSKKKRSPQVTFFQTCKPENDDVMQPMSEEAKHVSPSPTSATDCGVDVSSLKLELVHEELQMDLGLSCQTTDSVCSPVTPPKASGDSIFDEEVLSALAAVENDSRLREEQAYLAIMRSISR